MSRTLPPQSSLLTTTSRQIAPLPHQHNQQRWTPYSPTPIELYPGPKNRLFLSLRSGLDEEVDYALPKLVVASFDEIDKFKLETWVDSVSALKEWPERWLEGLELEVAHTELQRQQRSKHFSSPTSGGREEGEEVIDLDLKAKVELALSVIPSWTLPQTTIDRATNSLLVLRNASFTHSNAKIICRTSFLSFLNRFFSLPIDFLLELSLRTPEPIHHILNILQSIFPYLPQQFHDNAEQQGESRRIFSTVLPRLLVGTGDQAIIQNILPLLIQGLTNPQIIQFDHPTLSDLIDHLLNLIILRPTPTSSSSTPPILLDLALDLLISLTQNTQYSKSILSHPNFSAHLKNLVLLLEYGSRQTQATWDNAHSLTGKVIRNPASDYVRIENASKRRRMERDQSQKMMEIFGGPGVRGVNVGDKPPVLNKGTRERLFAMREPNRSIAWMHETFVYSSTSQLLQVTFWHAYRDFFQNPSTVDPLLSASEVIKNVTVAFPGAMAKVWTDELGGQKFVIAGMGFRRGNDDQERFTCLWQNCPSPHTPTDPASLFSHIQATHLSTPQITCQWATCTHSPFTTSHLLTHLPNLHPIQVPEVITSHASTPEQSLSQSIITDRAIPPLAKPFKLHFLGQTTPIDSQKRHPVGTAFLTSLIIRNLSKSLRSELSLIDGDLLKEKREEKKKHLLEERFGLPIPENVLREEEAEEQENLRNTQQDIEEDDEYTRERLEKARNGFISVQETLQSVVECNISGLGGYLGDSLGWY
ncbi:hypothetical protein I302_105485 [Kwoniella bestiolae CBS 10118]|uniref:RFX-type winged-helix domain-containing protein n=1 Tax=Kwoniella bestiolae CBS 10118 TaxID=1296100 RepID=A0A1B9FT91_9TREE|nr:hypothetical protein I302_08767 [Kwoniella bestiolae CBS 10118]OCF21986.1 hypothetical protein I302_08767 [Kwoniella bestiolae CBS 10118]